MKFLVRNTKDKTHRLDRPNGMVLPPDKQLLFFLTEQLGKVKRKHAPGTKGHMPAIESSYGRFAEHLESMDEHKHHVVSHYRELSRKLFKAHYQKSIHPKMDAIAQEAFENWKKGEKTLIFCFYVKTIDELSASIEAKVRDHIEAHKKLLFKKRGADFETFRNNIGIANNMSSLVFKDNLFKVSLLPLLSEHKLDSLIFLTPKDNDEIMDIVYYLRKISFNPTGANFSKLVAAFTYFAFGKFHKKYRKLIPVNLVDDFEYIMDPDSLKKMFRRQDSHPDGDTRDFDKKDRTPAIKAYVENLIQDKSRLLALMSHSTIWEHHRDSLEKLDVEVRVKITDIISSYLTGDEYLFLELLPHFESRPSVDAIPAAYLNSKPMSGESTYSKVCRFLDSASDMATENLDVLADEMNHRYQRNKMNSERLIVEKVTGEDNHYEKIRTVTAFKTPLPPYILLSTSVLAEGVDLHTECRHIVHYDHEWNPAKLEQKTGRVDRVGSKSERLSEKIDVQMPYIKHTQDEKAYRVVMARKSWFDTVMGENYEAKWHIDQIDNESVFPLPERIKEELRMALDNEAHVGSSGVATPSPFHPKC